MNRDGKSMIPASQFIKKLQTGVHSVIVQGKDQLWWSYLIYLLKCRPND